ncbi:MAG: hypothetical protein IPL32_03080 [Chloracidobacterium sp.]|nr:hypothetical protein [Chloracidobacterium sp.]
MRSQVIICFAVAMFAVAMSACGGSPPANSGKNTNTVSVNTNTTSNSPLDTKKNEPEAVTNNAPTLTPVFKSFCEAWSKNDEAALRKIYSQDTIKFFEAQMKADKAKNLLKYLEATDKVSGTPCNVTNEKIDGDKAVATIHSDKYPRGIQVVFVKESGEWKMTNKSPAIDSMKSTANANTTK